MAPHSPPVDPRAARLALASLCLAAFIAPLAMAAVNLALPDIARDLHVDAVNLSWVASIPVWGSVVLMLPLARAADLWGRKRIHLTGLALFSLASLGAAASATLELLIAMRVLQGLASAFIFATAMAMVTVLAGSERRGMYLGF
ncbi:MAG: MFS transporter, partial [Pseudomonadales bacterium]